MSSALQVLQLLQVLPATWAKEPIESDKTLILNDFLIVFFNEHKTINYIDLIFDPK